MKQVRKLFWNWSKSGTEKDYLVGDNLDLSEGRFAVTYSNDTMEEHSFTDEELKFLVTMLKRLVIKPWRFVTKS